MIRGNLFAFLLLVALAVPVRLPGPGSRKYDNTFQLGEHPAVLLNNNSLRGNITVKAWSDPGVRVVAQLESPGTEVRCEKSAGTLMVSLRRQRSGAEDPAQFEVWTPRDATLELTAFGGTISVEGMDGRIKLRTTDGAIDITNCAGKKVDALSSTSGNILMKGPLVSPTVYSLYSGSGRIEIRMVKPSSFTLHAATHSGRIDLGGIRLRELRRNDRLVEGDFGGGDSLLHVRTHSGEIHLRMD